MYRQFEIILSAVSLVLTFLFLVFIIIRIRNLILHREKRISIRHKEAGVLNRVLKLTLATAIPFLVAGFLYFLFITTLPTSVMKEFIKIQFSLLFITWMMIEFILCFSISKKIINGFGFRRILFFLIVVLSLAGAIHFFPLIPKSLPFPPESECVILELPVWGSWLAGQAGATTITNGHSTNRFAIDVVKLGPDGRFFKNECKAITDFYSFDEPVYAPADGIVTEVVDTLISDSLGIMDKNNTGGNKIIIDIGDGRYVYFAHLRKGSIPQKAGETVKAGEMIGLVGNSGYSTSPHLHMHIQNKPVSDQKDRQTYPFRFRKMNRTRFFFQSEVQNGYLIRNDKFSN
jgi:hypothetical protein